MPLTPRTLQRALHLTDQQWSHAEQHAGPRQIQASLIALALATPRELAQAIARLTGQPFWDLDAQPADGRLLALAPRQVWQQLQVLPLEKHGQQLRIGIVDLLPSTASDHLRLLTGHDLECYICPQSRIAESLV